MAVEDGVQAVERATGFDIICLDRHMPGLSGNEVARRIGRRAFLIACTSDPEGVEGFDVVIAKPVSTEAIVVAMRSARRWITARKGRDGAGA